MRQRQDGHFLEVELQILHNLLLFFDFFRDLLFPLPPLVLVSLDMRKHEPGPL